MQKALDKNSIEYKFMRDYWGFIQEWFAPDGDLNKWWSDFHAAANKFSEDYAGCKFAQEHILCFCLYQEKKYKGDSYDRK